MNKWLWNSVVCKDSQNACKREMLPCIRALLNNSIRWARAGKSGESPTQCRYCNDWPTRIGNRSQNTDRPPKQAATSHGEGFEARGRKLGRSLRYQQRQPYLCGAAFLRFRVFSPLVWHCALGFVACSRGLVFPLWCCASHPLR